MGWCSGRRRYFYPANVGGKGNFLNKNEPSMYILECALFVKRHYSQFFKRYETDHCRNITGNLRSYLVAPQTKLTKVQQCVILLMLFILLYLPFFNVVPYRINWPLLLKKKKLLNLLMILIEIMFNFSWSVVVLQEHEYYLSNASRCFLCKHPHTFIL